MAYRNLFGGFGIRHSNTGLHIPHAAFVNGYFMLLFDLTPDHGASENHTSFPDSGNIRIEARFAKALPVATTCLLYLELNSYVVAKLHDRLLIVLMDTRQIMCCLLYVSSFLDVLPSDLLPRHPIERSGTLIVIADPHTESVSHWQALHFQP